MKVAVGKMVRFHFTLQDEGGATLETSTGKEPASYRHGGGAVIPAVEKALEGAKAGDQLSVEVPPGRGFGDRDEELVLQVPKTRFAGVDEIEVGMQFQVGSADGESHLFRVVAVEGDSATIDGNHPLAGQTVRFDLEVLDVREATEEELSDDGGAGSGGE